MNPIKRKLAIDIFDCITLLAKYCGKPKLAHAFSINLKRLTDEVEAYKEAAKPSAAFVKFEEARTELLKQYCQTDELGELVWLTMPDGMTKRPDFKDFVGYSAAFKKLEAEHAEAVVARTAQAKELDDMLNAETAIAFYKAELSWFLEDSAWDLERMKKDGVNLSEVMRILSGHVYDEAAEAPVN